MVSGALFYYASGLIGLGIRDVLSSSFYALKLTTIPLINSIQMVVLNVVASIILSKFMGLNGLALGSTIASFFGAFNLYMKLEKKIGKIKCRVMIKNIYKMLISGLLMAIGSRIIFYLLHLKFSGNFSLIISIIFAVIIYAVSSILLKTRQALDILKVIIKKF